jgi:hypothetical protein
MRAHLARSSFEDGSCIHELLLDPVCRFAICFEADGTVHCHIVSRWWQKSWTLK